MNKKTLTKMIKSSRLSASSGHNLPAPIQHYAGHKIESSRDAHELINRYIDYCNMQDTRGQDMHLCEHFIVVGLIVTISLFSFKSSALAVLIAQLLTPKSLWPTCL